MNIVWKFVRDETGSAAIEYALIAAGISLAIVTALTGISSKFGAMFELTEDALR